MVNFISVTIAQENIVTVRFTFTFPFNLKIIRSTFLHAAANILDAQF